MHFIIYTIATVASAALTQAATLSDVCTTAHIQASLPANDFIQGITINPDSVSANAITDASVTGQVMFPDAVFDYCNATFTYTHNGLNDQVTVQYWLPAPESFQNRYLSTGGGGYAINSGSQSLPGGIMYGAAAGRTDGGFGGFDTQFDAAFLAANGSVNWQAVYMFGYQGIHEMSVLGKELTKQFFAMNSTKLYSYYQGCSEGGREGWSQLQRFPDQFDGAVTGAPAMRFAHQQTQHLYSNVVEQTLGYFPPPCELAKIVNLTLAACDSMDGKSNGVVARSDLCQLNFNINSTIGEPYFCAATEASTNPFGPSAPAAPAQNGSVSAQAVAVASKILQGMQDTQGRQVYFSYQTAASFVDAQTKYNNATGQWELSVSGLGAEFPARLLELKDTSTFANLDDVTYDTLKDWILQGWQMYEDTLQTTWPDLTPLQAAGVKVLHYHGEADDSIPAASSVRYHESVRSTMYPTLSFNDSTAALGDWYRLFLVPGAAHCSTNTLQPNGPFPQTNLAVLIDWVENGVKPETLNATILNGDSKGSNEQICAWPLRPLWTQGGNGTGIGLGMECVYDQTSINTWLYDLDAWKMPVY